MAKVFTVTELGYTLTASLIGPLTTTFTPPSSCLTDIYSVTSTANPQTLFLGQQSQSECYPTNLPNLKSPHDVIHVPYYSPGICPSGYLSGCPEFQSLLESNETGTVCCPSGYTCDHRYPTGYVAHCTSVLQSDTFAIVDPAQKDVGVVATAGSTVTAAAIRIRWQETDFPTNITATGKAHNGLSDSGKVAVSILVPLAVAVLVRLAFYLYSRRQRFATGLGSQDNMTADNRSGPLEGRTVRDPLSVSTESGSSTPHPRMNHGSKGPVPTTNMNLNPEPLPYNHDAMIITPLSPGIGSPIVHGADNRTGRWKSQQAPYIGHSHGKANVVEDEELRLMLAEQERLKERRERLRALEAIDAAETRLRERIQERINMLGGSRS